MGTNSPQHEPILLVEDNANDAAIMRRAVTDGGLRNPLQVVNTGEDAIAYLSGDGPYRNRAKYPLPILILLDLTLPGKSGFDVLRWIKQQEHYRRIPVIVLTGSNSLADANTAYSAGANSFFLKDIDLKNAVEFCSLLKKYWLERAIIPHPNPPTTNPSASSE